MAASTTVFFSTAFLACEGWGEWNGLMRLREGTAGGRPVAIHTLLDPEETSLVGFGFSVRIAITPGKAYRGSFSGWCFSLLGGGWLLVEMCIVDASILFFCVVVCC